MSPSGVAARPQRQVRVFPGQQGISFHHSQGAARWQRALRWRLQNAGGSLPSCRGCPMPKKEGLMDTKCISTPA